MDKNGWLCDFATGFAVAGTAREGKKSLLDGNCCFARIYRDFCRGRFFS